VGGVAGLALVGALIWFILRRRRQNNPGAPMEVYDTVRGADYEQEGTTAMRKVSGSEFKSSEGPVEMATDGHQRHELGDETQRAEMEG
jgi:hypothetical protein